MSSSWTADQQTSLESRAASFHQQYQAAMQAWGNAIQSGGNTVVAKAAVEGIRDNWQQFLNQLQTQSDLLYSSENVMESLGSLASQIADEKALLARLRNQAITRGDQADSVNPKIRPSPYTNLLGLHRVFRDSTRFGILAATILFGLGALGAVGIFVADRVNGGPLFVSNEFADAGVH